MPHPLGQFLRRAGYHHSALGRGCKDRVQLISHASLTTGANCSDFFRKVVNVPVMDAISLSAQVVWICSSEMTTVRSNSHGIRIPHASLISPLNTRSCIPWESKAVTSQHRKHVLSHVQPADDKIAQLTRLSGSRELIRHVQRTWLYPMHSNAISSSSFAQFSDMFCFLVTNNL